MLNNIIADLKSLEGKKVDNGYFEHIYNNEVSMDTINIIDILENLKQYEISDEFVASYFDDNNEEIFLEIDFKEYAELMGYEEIKHDNSYNWNAPISNNFNYKIYESEACDNIIVEFKVHRYGDVRCNYTENCYLQFDNEYEFMEALYENNKYFTIEKNDKEYYVEINIFNDCPIIEIDDDYIEGYEAYELLESLIED